MTSSNGDLRTFFLNCVLNVRLVRLRDNSEKSCASHPFEKVTAVLGNSEVKS